LIACTVRKSGFPAPIPMMNSFLMSAWSSSRSS
jgi:hypothetical protein